jgi:hypothetical protein
MESNLPSLSTYWREEMKIPIGFEERHDFMYLLIGNNGYGRDGDEMEVPDELIERYKRIEPEFEKIQKELGELWGAYYVEKREKLLTRLKNEGKI